MFDDLAAALAFPEDQRPAPLKPGEEPGEEIEQAPEDFALVE